MATETYASRGNARWYPRMTRSRLGLLTAIVTLCALAVVAVEIVAPLSAGLPIGWGQYDKAEFHLRIGTPPFWTAATDPSSTRCALIVAIAPPGQQAPSMRSALSKMPRSMSVYATAPCASAPDLTQAWVWRSTGQRVTVAGQVAPVEINSTPDIPQVSYRARVTLHGYHYTLMLDEPSTAQAQQDMPAFLTFIQSFRYTS